MQKYEVKGNILGFEKTMNVEIVQIDNLFSTIRDLDNEGISFTVVNPYELREYSFDVKSNIKVLLDIKENSNLSAYNIVVIQKPLENSTVNFLAPIVINNDNMTIAQAVLDPKRHPDFGMAESIKAFM
ncbi:MAG: flagellar assembly protein FliW [Sulfurimonas sp.]|uniref:flagellar assembly protein FliW n=1 Tax=Sulfurimonas sp. TaxID=2022749 RepID=UPI0025DC6DD1|nr:flagellar assembly protein FliW [Sulfurimonas sp.]MCK9491547.1 flagellar assembly protein FliW [Sulfurimonas sp.]